MNSDVIKRSVFYVYLGHPLEDEDRRWCGTAFAVSPKHCLTATHVIQQVDENRLYLFGPGLDTPQKIHYFESHPERDVTLTFFDNGAPDFEHFLPLSDVSLASYSDKPELPLFSFGYVSPKESLQRFLVQVSQYNGDVSAWGLNGFVKDGRSGGPLLNAQSHVLGVVFASASEKNNHYAIAVDSFRPWLDETLTSFGNSSDGLSKLQRTAIDALRKGQVLSSSNLTRLQSATVDSHTALRLQRFAIRSKARPLNEAFVNLVLLIDHGKGNQEGRFLPDTSSQQHHNLSSLLQERDELALVLIGRPGNGKTTLLRHLELKLCQQALLDNDSTLALPFYLELNQFPPKGEDAISPFDWLAKEWHRRYPHLPDFSSTLKQQAVLLLLDALNEMQIPRAALEEKIRAWRAFLLTLKNDFPLCRALFSCRSMDYSSVLSDARELPVPQIRFEELSALTVKSFCCKALGEDVGQALADSIVNAQGLELQTPYYLELAVRFYEETGRLPRGSSELIATMIWLSLKSEYQKQQPSSLLFKFLSSHEKTLLSNEKAGLNCPHKLPKESTLFRALIELAWSMQSGTGGDKEISKNREDIIAVFQPYCENNAEQADELKTLAEQLDFLVEVEPERSWKFSHQLLQEYFAAQRLAHAQESDLQHLYKPWRRALSQPLLEGVLQKLRLRHPAQPPLPKVLEKLGVADPLPPRSATGWEETCYHAVAIAKNASGFTAQVAQQDLVLAARCAQHPEVGETNALPLEQIEALQRRLLKLCQNPQADLRARVEAGLALGRLGDPRFELVNGKESKFIRPPLVTLPAGSYAIGSEEGESDEKPLHSLELEAFAIGQYPVTNAEWTCFMDAGGYEDERWWRTEDAQLWQQGKLEQTDITEKLVNLYRALKEDFEGTCLRIGAKSLSRNEYQNWLHDFPAEAQFNAAIKEQLKPRRYYEPVYWHNERFNNPSQPVVGICWYEALAYCNWLNAQRSGVFSLPSEAQWKAAAGGIRGERFPWGNQPQVISFAHPLANTEELHLRCPTPVGLFGEGAVRRDKQFIYDLAGNVWEWNKSLFQGYPIMQGDQRDDLASSGHRSVSGGAWGGSAGSARAACRGSDRPLNRYFLGFRVLCSPPSQGTEH